MISSGKDSAIALFDFDGTITRKDTLFQFILFVKGVFVSYSGFALLLPVFILHKLKLYSNHRAKEKVFSFFFKGTSLEYLKKRGQEFTEVINKTVNKSAIEKINWHKSKNHIVYVVTASSELWVGEWCRQNKIKLIATSYEVYDGKITGKIKGFNCQGEEKVNRIKEVCDLSGYQHIYAYGDTKGDLPMLGLAHYKFYRKFD